MCRKFSFIIFDASSGQWYTYVLDRIIRVVVTENAVKLFKTTAFAAFSSLVLLVNIAAHLPNTHNACCFPHSLAVIWELWNIGMYSTISGTTYIVTNGSIGVGVWGPPGIRQDHVNGPTRMVPRHIFLPHPFGDKE